ncbi:MAG: hypothetical protein IIA14_15290 [SAR324 cluster bacterium]|nr:hypothetical protein [SAR324 cluster bacterium]
MDDAAAPLVQFQHPKKIAKSLRTFLQFYQLSDLTVKGAEKSKTGATTTAEKGKLKFQGVTVKNHTVFRESEIAPDPNE